MQDVVVAIDLGGTQFRVAVFPGDEGGPIVTIRRATEAADGLQHVLDRIHAAVADACAAVGRPVRSLGLAAPGPLDPWRGIVYRPPNMPGWPDETPLQALLEERLGIPCLLGNDANLAAIGEHRAGAGRGFGDVVYLTVSTGVGGGVIADHRLLLGADGLAAELGHMIIQPGGPPCNCGAQGCLEAFASGTSIARAATARLLDGAPSRLRDLLPLDAKDVEDAAMAGDPLAREVFDQAARMLGVGVVNAIHLFNPAIVILGGGVTRAGDLLFGPVRDAVQTLTMPRYRRTPIVRAALGDDAGLFGAAALARERRPDVVEHTPTNEGETR